MTQEKLNKLLEKEDLQIDVFDEMCGTTKEDKERYAIEKIIEDNIECPNCKEMSLTGCDPTIIQIMCSKCGNIYFEDDLIK